jgi:hypothetical protein
MTPEERLVNLRQMVEDKESVFQRTPNPNAWNDLLSLANKKGNSLGKNLSDVTADPEFMEECMIELMQTVAEKYGIMPDGPLSHSMTPLEQPMTTSSGRFEASAVLHLEPMPYNASAPPGFGDFCVSFSAMGRMDDRTGHKVWMLSCCHNMDGCIRAFGQAAKEKPDAEDCGKVLMTAMLKPMHASGPPCRPRTLILAHRWGQAVFDALEPELLAAGIQPTLESLEDAKLSAANNGTDPMGLNF